MLKIKQSNKFKKEYSNYVSDIENVSNIHVKEECYELLNKIVQQLSIIDATHDTINKSIDPTKIRENVELSVNLRQKLNKLIKDSKSL